MSGSETRGAGASEPDRESETAGPTSSTILVIDDDPGFLRLQQRILESGGYRSVAASSGSEGRTLASERRFDLVLCDVRMPGEDGLEVIEALRAIDPDLGIVMVSGISDPSVARVATTRGAYGYLVKPFEPTELLIAVANGLHRRRLEVEKRRHTEMLEAEVARRTTELEAAVEEITRSRRETILHLTRAVEIYDTETGLHVERIGRLAALLGSWIGLDASWQETLLLAAPMHDVGKIGIPDEIVRKPGPLDDREREVMQQHTIIGHRLLEGSQAPLLDVAASIALTHHERWDGTGYPNGLGGEEIPLEGRIVAVVDVFDALLSDRSYRQAMSAEEVIAMLERDRGTHFDPDIVSALLARSDEAFAARAPTSPPGMMAIPS